MSVTDKEGPKWAIACTGSGNGLSVHVEGHEMALMKDLVEGEAGEEVP